MEEVVLGIGGGVGCEVDWGGDGEAVDAGGIGHMHVHSDGQVGGDGGAGGDPRKISLICKIYPKVSNHNYPAVEVS